MTEITTASTLLKTLLQRYIEQPKRPIKSANSVILGLACKYSIESTVFQKCLYLNNEQYAFCS